MSYEDWHRCAHCAYEGYCYGNGYSSPWCSRCGLNRYLTKAVHPNRIINGNVHLANVKAVKYDGLLFVTESPKEGAVRLTVYRGDESTPLSTEVYSNE